METDLYFCYLSRKQAELVGIEHDPDENGLCYAELSKEQVKQLIPEGAYCYQPAEECSPTGYKIRICPFWDKFKEIPEQMNGFCHYLKMGDFTKDGTIVLWDQCKECGIKDG